MFQVGDDVDVPLVSPADISYQVGNSTHWDKVHISEKMRDNFAYFSTKKMLFSFHFVFALSSQ